MVSLKGQVGLIVGIANEQSIAWGCARHLREAGAELVITYLNPKAEPFVRPLAEAVGSELILPLNVEHEGEMAAVFDAIAARYGRLDFVLHSIAFAPMDDLHGRVVDCTEAGFLRAMNVSCHSFIKMARFAEPLMDNGGTLLTMSYYGAEKVVTNYNLMGPVKAALEAATRYMAQELGPKGIRVHAISPGPLKTRAACGISEFDRLMEQAIERAPQHTLVDIDDIGAVAAFLCSPSSKAMTGSTIHVDGGYHIVG